jgi:hypothetical protein
VTVHVDQVAQHLGIPADPRMHAATLAACMWTVKRRCNTPPQDLWVDPDVVQGTVLYAALLYQARSTPAGFAGYDQVALATDTSTEALWRARELVGLDPVVA